MSSVSDGWITAAAVITIFVLIPMAIVLSIIASKNIKERQERLTIIELLKKMR
jgi:hypothetical protein